MATTKIQRAVRSDLLWSLDGFGSLKLLMA